MCLFGYTCMLLFIIEGEVKGKTQADWHITVKSETESSK